MKHVMLILMFAATVLHAEDGLFVMDPHKTPKASIDGSELVMRIPLQKMKVPKAKKVLLFESAGASHGAYTIQVDLEKSPEEGWMPIVVLGNAVLVEGVGVSRSGSVGSMLTYGTDDPAQAEEFLARTAKLFGLTGKNVRDMREKKTGPDGASPGSRSTPSATNSTPSRPGSVR